MQPEQAAVLHHSKEAHSEGNEPCMREQDAVVHHFHLASISPPNVAHVTMRTTGFTEHEMEQTFCNIFRKTFYL